ncbi:MAG: hypothetical protein WD492_05020 [Alkalispirochaeta sp.]
MHAGGPAAHLSGVLLLGLPIPGTGLPFHGVLTELHQWLSRNNIVYTVIGGVAVVRSGSSRTTGDIDLLVRQEEWNRLQKSAAVQFQVGPAWAIHNDSGTPIDVLYAGDDWDLPFLLPDPEHVREWDPAVGAWFITPAALLELKAAVYLSKRSEYGDATAAHDLADVAALLSENRRLGKDAVLESLHPSVRDVIRTTLREVERYRRKQPRHRSNANGD